jgi:hypothetical protein
VAGRSSLTFTVPLYSRWTRERLEARRKTLGEKAFARGFKQKSAVEGELTFPAWAAMKEKARAGGRLPLISDTFQSSWPVFAGVDLSTDTRPGNVIFVLALTPARQKLPLAIMRGAWQSPVLAQKLEDVWKLFHPDVIKVENNAYQKAFIEWGKAGNYSWRRNVEGFLTGSNKANESLGLPSIQTEFENDGWLIPWGEWEDDPSDCDCGWCVWDREMAGHPTLGDDQTDTVMACWFAREASKRGERKPAGEVPFPIQ